MLAFPAFTFSIAVKFTYSVPFLSWHITVGASGVRDFETVTFQVCTEPKRLFIKHHFKTVIRQRRIGGD
jgi:hypothetical protein